MRSTTGKSSVRAASRLAIVLLLGAAPAPGQLTGVTAAKNPANSPDRIFSDIANHYERESAVAITKTDQRRTSASAASACCCTTRRI